MPKENKVDNIEKLKRVRFIQNAILTGKYDNFFVKALSVQWNISERQVKNYVAEAYELFRAETSKKVEDTKAFHIKARMELFKTVLERSKTDPYALEILKDIAKIEGLYVSKVDHTTGGKELPANTNTTKTVITLSNGTSISLD